MSTSYTVRRRASVSDLFAGPICVGSCLSALAEHASELSNVGCPYGMRNGEIPWLGRCQLSAAAHSATSGNQLQQQGPSRRRVGVSDRSVASTRGLRERQTRPEGLCGRRLVRAIAGWQPSDPGLLRLCSPYSLSAFITRQFVTTDRSDQPLWICGFTREGAVSGANFSAIATLREAPNAERKRAGTGPGDRCVGNSPMSGWGRKTHKRPLPRAS